jgi:hypothetical protein
MIFAVHVRSHPIAGGIDEDVLVAIAEIADRMHRISDAVISGGGDPSIIDLRCCVEAGSDPVRAAKTGVQAYKDAVRSAGLSGVEIATLDVGPDPCPNDGQLHAAELAVASR